MKTTIQRKIGKNRGKARLWIEGMSLESMGWETGERFTALWQTGRLVYAHLLTAEGTTGKKYRKVAGGAGRPIIDTNTDKLLETLGCQVGDVVTIEITHEQITVRKYNPATDDKAESMKQHHRAV